MSGPVASHARLSGATWTVTTVDAQASGGDYASLAFGPDGQPAFAYFYGFEFDLRIARRLPFRSPRSAP